MTVISYYKILPTNTILEKEAILHEKLCFNVSFKIIMSASIASLRTLLRPYGWDRNKKVLSVNTAADYNSEL